VIRRTKTNINSIWRATDVVLERRCTKFIRKFKCQICVIVVHRSRCFSLPANVIFRLLFLYCKNYDFQFWCELKIFSVSTRWRFITLLHIRTVQHMQQNEITILLAICCYRNLKWLLSILNSNQVSESSGCLHLATVITPYLSCWTPR